MTLQLVRFVIHGEPASKANQRQLVMRGKKPMLIKSEKALAYEAAAIRQVPPKCRLRLEGPVRFTARIFYASERPDLDESVLLDCLQDMWTTVRVPAAGGGINEVRQLVQAGVYRNDRQVRERHVFHGIDRAMPRAEIEIAALAPQQSGMFRFDPAFGWVAQVERQGALV